MDSEFQSQMRKLHILLIEDDALVLTTLRSLLESFGHAVVCAANQIDAEMAFSLHQKVELVLSDYNLPGTTGVVLARRFAERTPALRVIVMSGEDLGHGTLNEIRSRGWTFLPKPMKLDSLVEALEGAQSG
jgi:DNA-binding NtrC family response regulator